MADNNEKTLETKIQSKTVTSTQWISDNRMLCSGGKTKLLILCTKESREKLKAKNKIFKFKFVEKKLFKPVVRNSSMI